jgi:predicted O-linked N-acetylglucosamine transferase (SPINDLY family)
VRLGNLNDAVGCFERALQLNPGYVLAHYNLGIAREAQGRLGDSIGCFRQALQFGPEYAPAHYALGVAWEALGRWDDAAESYRRAWQLQPESAAAAGALTHARQQMCQWDGLTSLAQQVIERAGCKSAETAPVSPFCFLALPLPTTPEQQLQNARQWVARHVPPAGEFEIKRPRSGQAHPKSVLKIGYLSADFHAHPTAWLSVELFEKHDRRRFTVLGYSCGPDDGSSIRRRVASAFDRFVDLKDASSIDAARRIAADEVDILIDLKGHTKSARTGILALRPAPIQVNYLGYPGTMGAPFMDYILVDDFIVPAEQQPFFTETLVHLPGCYQVNDSLREIAPRTPTRAACGFPDTAFVYCAFHASFKITPEVFQAWMELLQQVPGSVLWLLDSNRFARTALQHEAAARGVPQERLDFAPRLPLSEHLAGHRLADLYLDTFPCNAHTTASDALWAGCPVMTRAGDTFASRVAGSLLRSLGLADLVTASVEEYRDVALQLARDAHRLADLYRRLEAGRRTSPLFDGGVFARNVEKAYSTMWRIYATGEAPRSFAVEPA